MDASKAHSMSFTYKVKKGVCYLRFEAHGTGESLYNFKVTYAAPETGISKLSSAKKAFRAKWDKRDGASKYQIRYFSKKNMSSAKVVDVKGSKSSVKIKGLKGKKKYYVQVRVVQSVGDATYYSAWSEKKTVITKS